MPKDPHAEPQSTPDATTGQETTNEEQPAPPSETVDALAPDETHAVSAQPEPSSEPTPPIESVAAEASVTVEHHVQVPVEHTEPVSTEHSEPVVVEHAEPHEEEVQVILTPEAIEEVEAEPEEDYSQLSQEDLAVRMENFSREAEVNSVKNRVHSVREVFYSLFNQERDTALAAFLEAGGERADFEYKSPVEERFTVAYKLYQKRRSEYVLGQEKLRADNLKQKHDILTQMKNILQKEEDMSKAFNDFHELQARWRGIGPVPPQHVNDLWMTYKLYTDRFYEFIRLNRELQDLEMKKNLEMKMQLCERAEELLLEPSLNKALQEVQLLQQKWREIGSVPREKRTEIWLRFKAAADKVYENKREYLDSQKKVFESNYNAKSALITQAEELVNRTVDRHQQWQDNLKQLLELQAEWRKIGPAGKEHNDSVWQKFKGLSDQFFKRKDEFYKNRKKEYAANLQAKTELCIQAEALIDSLDWKATSQEMARLQQEWKKIGPAGDKNEKIWQRFRAAADSFYNRKNEHFAGQDEAQAVNLGLKNELIGEVERYERPGDPSEAIEQLKAFQRKFTEIGLVPFKQKEDIQQRFRAAIQVHFDALKSTPEYRQSIRRSEPGNRSENRPRPAGARMNHPRQPQEAEGSDEQRNLMSRMNKLNGEVQLWENNLGFFANSKNASALKQEYEQKIQAARDEINKLKAKLQELKNPS